jgi:hypothetical protein
MEEFLVKEIEWSEKKLKGELADRYIGGVENGMSWDMDSVREWCELCKLELARRRKRSRRKDFKRMLVIRLAKNRISKF